MIKKKVKLECGKRLKDCLASSHITQKELADKTGYTPQYISNIICGKKNMSTDAARLFSKFLNIREQYLLCEDDYKTEYELFENIDTPLSFFDSATYAYLHSIGHTLTVSWEGVENSQKFASFWNSFYNDDFELDNSFHDRKIVFSESSDISFMTAGANAVSFSNTSINIDGNIELSLVDYLGLVEDLKDYANFLISTALKRKERRLSNTAICSNTNIS